MKPRPTLEQTHLGKDRAQEEPRGDIGSRPHAALGEVLAHEQNRRDDDRVGVIRSRPNRPDETEQDELGTTRERFGFRSISTTHKPLGQILLHQRDLRDEVRGSGAWVELDQGDEVRNESGDQIERGGRARGEDQDVIEQDSEKVLERISTH